MSRNNKCPHLDNVLQLSLLELCKLKQGYPCSECNANGPNLWICLHKDCLHTGCSELYNDHSTKHFKNNHSHCIHMNLSSQRIWCYLCETEVFLKYQRRSSLISNDSSETNRYANSEKIIVYDKNNREKESCDSSGEDDDGDRCNLGGLVGLQNIANTCYMNAALQALSNTPQLTGYFLDCGAVIEATSELLSTQKKPGLAKSYHRLIKEMWCRNRRSNGYVVPTGILYGIRNVHPMFRGFQQHDTQEFLRCFMDQLHEELKETVPPPPAILFDSTENDDQSQCSSASQSEGEYETCDSGVSEQSSLSDEGINYMNIKLKTRPPSPVINQRNSTSNTVTIKPGMLGSRSGAASSPSQNNLLNKKESIQKSPHTSIISEVFDGKLLSSVQCLTCDRISTREETFQDLSLPIPGKDHLTAIHLSHGISTSPGMSCADASYQATSPDGWFWWFWNWVRSWFWGPAVTLHDCMAAFFSADELKGDNMYSCEKCNKLRNGVKFSRVLELPEMLCVHLKRFRHDLSYSSKIGSPVMFPLVGLDMRPYLHKDCKSKIASYDLTAVICHHGTVGGGHYTAYAKHEQTGKWFEYDDQLVTQVIPEVVQNCEAYVLFYRKSNPQMGTIRAQAIELVDLNPPQASDIRFFVSRQWLNRFNTFAEPGPIDNWALLCPHGGLPPCKAALASRLVVPLPQPLWDFLYTKFGGGPACNHLFECDTCRRAAESLSRRQKLELDMFTIYNDEFQYQDNSSTIYAISMAWFRQWQYFARGVTTEEPGPINNTSIALHSDSLTIRCVKSGSDYAQINATLWNFFHGIYGGGPEIILHGGTPEIKNQQEIEPEDLNESDITVKATSNSKQSFSQTDNPKIHKQPSPIKRESTNTQPPVELQNIEIMPNDTDSGETNNTVESVTKIIKNVSFDNVENIKLSDDNVVTLSNSVPEFVIPPLKRTKNNQINRSSEIVNKKDKRYRAMKSIGFFGPDGNYKTNISPGDGTLINNSSATTVVDKKNTDNSIKNEEVMTTLQQTTLTTSPSIDFNNTMTTNDGSTIINDSQIINSNKQIIENNEYGQNQNNGNNNNSIRNVNRAKKYKSKNYRKINSRSNDMHLSDSDK